MDTATLLALIGLVLTALGAWIANNRFLIKRMDEGDDKVSDTVHRAHERIDHIPREFVRREDMMDHFRRLETGMTDMRRETSQRLDRLYELVADSTIKKKDG